jgi:thiol-disulfide isomerase/thioredoxin
MRRLLLALFILHLACLAQCQLSSKQLQYPLVSLTGDSLTLGQLIKGKTAFINFWFIPCGPCFAEMPMMQKIFTRYSSDSNFIFLSISKSSPEAVKQFMTKTESDTSLYRYFKREVYLDTLTYPVLSVAKCQDLILGIVKVGGKYLLKMKAAPTDVEYNPGLVFHFDAFPTNILISREGKILFKKTGFSKKTEHETENEIIRIIEKALK